MSPELRKRSPRVTSAAVSAADRRWLAGDSVGAGEAARDVACGVVCSCSAAGAATPGGVAGGDTGFCFVGSRVGASAAAGGAASGTRAGCAGSGVAAGEIARGAAGSRAGASPVPGSAACGTRKGCDVPAIGGTLETIGARSAGGAAFAGVSLGADLGVDASRGEVGPVAERSKGAPARLKYCRNKKAPMPTANSTPKAARPRNTPGGMPRDSVRRCRAASWWRRNSMLSSWPTS